MRIDARNLLDRLGKSDFAYKEFEDRFTDLELWPILEALLRDPRLQALDPAVPAKAAPAPASERSEAAVPNTPDQAQPLKTLFDRYEQAADAPAVHVPAPSPPHDQDVRGLLRRLSGSEDSRGVQGDD